jgi:hypothetical protein
MNNHNREPTGRWIWGLVAALAVWGLYLAVGAFRFNHDVWRGVVVFGCMAAFLGFWLVMMKLRRNREPRIHGDLGPEGRKEIAPAVRPGNGSSESRR